MDALKTKLIKSAWNDDKSMDVLINKWLDNHNYCRLVDIKFAINNFNTEEALIIYYEDSDVLAEIWDEVETFIIPR